MSSPPPDHPFQDEDHKKKPLNDKAAGAQPISQAEAQMEIEDADSLGKKQAQSMASEDVSLSPLTPRIEYHVHCAIFATGLQADDAHK